MNLLEIARLMRNRTWAGYAVALTGSLAGIVARFALGPALEGYPFITFFPGILLASFAGGIGAGAVAALTSAVLAAYFLIHPIGSLRPYWPSGWVGMMLFAIATAIMIALIDFAMRTSERLANATDSLRWLNERLEERVAERTRELTMLNAQLRDEIKSREIAESHVRQLQKMEAVGRLTGGIAHDFNNMLSIVLGSLDIMRRRLTQGRDIVIYLDNAMDGARRAATLTAQLLAFSRQQPLAPVIVDVNGLVSITAELLRRTLGELVQIECVLAGGLWRTCVDPGQLENAILNVAVNARDAMPQGGRLTIETQNTFLDDVYGVSHADVSPGQYVLVAVTDTGTGMTDDVVSRAFDPFFTTKEEGHGTGLGLSQVHGFIKQSKGHIKIYSEIGHGTAVKIYLPRYVGATGTGKYAAEPPAAETIPAGSSEEIILLVEDDDAVRRIHVGMLRELNYTVRHAGGGAEALAILQEQGNVTLLFTDVVMPGIDGRKLAEAAARLIPDLKVIYTTGYTPNAIVHNGVMDAGVDLLPKPFAYDQLARKVRSVIDRSQS